MLKTLRILEFQSNTYQKPNFNNFFDQICILINICCISLFFILIKDLIIRIKNPIMIFFQTGTS